MKILIELDTLQYSSSSAILSDANTLIALGRAFKETEGEKGEKEARRLEPKQFEWTVVETPHETEQETVEVSYPDPKPQVEDDTQTRSKASAAASEAVATLVDIATGKTEKRRPGRPPAEKLPAAEIKKAQQDAIQQAIADMTRGQASPQAPVAEIPPPPPKHQLPLPPALPASTHAAGTLPALPQLPASTGPSSLLPAIPPDGQPMALEDFITVVRLSAPMGAGIAFEVMKKHGVTDGFKTPENLRAQVAREIAEKANLKG